MKERKTGERRKEIRLVKERKCVVKERKTGERTKERLVKNRKSVW